MRSARLWAGLLGLVKVVVEGVDFDPDAGEVVVSIRPRKGTAKPRCGQYGEPCPRYDRGDGRRRWRALDVGLWRCFVEAEAPRVRCGEHGVVVAQVPWARHGAGHTRAFDDQVAWLAVHTSKTAVVELMRVAWRTVGTIVERVVADGRSGLDPLEGLVRIGIDEISYKRHQHYLTVVVDHDSGRLVWVERGRDRKTLGRFFDLLGPERCAQLRLISADGADWIAEVVAARCPNAELCLDPFHIVAWATEALDIVRRQTWNDLRRTRGAHGIAQGVARSRFILWKAGERLDDRGRQRLAWIAEVNRDLYRAYLLKEQFRLIFQLRGDEAISALDDWLAWARRSQLPSFVEVARRVSTYRTGIVATLTYGLSNGLVESINTKIRLLARIAFGFKHPEALAALALLDRGGYCPPLPGRKAA